MSLIAIEGADCAGKTTLWKELRKLLPHAVAVSSVFPKELASVASFVEQREEALWHALYDDKRLYLLDRSFAISPLVYSSLSGRKLLYDATQWWSKHYVLFIDTPVQELCTRHNERAGAEWFPFEKYHECVDRYRDVIGMLDSDHVCTVDWKQPTAAQARYCLSWLRRVLPISLQ